jgi:hypothetical protein
MHICEFVEQALSDTQAEVTRRLPRKGDSSDSTDRDGALPGRGRHYLDKAVHKNRRFAGPGASVDQDVPITFRYGSIALRLVGCWLANSTHRSVDLPWI